MVSIKPKSISVNNNLTPLYKQLLVLDSKLEQLMSLESNEILRNDARRIDKAILKQ